MKSRIHLFADEAGNFDFRIGRPGASRYFILTTIAIHDCAIGDQLLELRRQLAWERLDLRSEFHATEESQVVRDRVFELISGIDFRVDTSIFTKGNVETRLQVDTDRFYKLAWLLHLRHVIPNVVADDDELLVIGATIGTRKKWSQLHAAITDVVRQVARTTEFRTAYWSTASEPCLQIADYCCWAIQRKWERDDDRSYVLIEDKVRSEFQFFSRGRDSTSTGTQKTG